MTAFDRNYGIALVSECLVAVQCTQTNVLFTKDPKIIRRDTNVEAQSNVCSNIQIPVSVHM